MRQVHARSEHLIGRREALAAVDRALAAVAAGSSALVVVSGEPGIGKSAVVQEAIRRVAAEGWTALRGRGVEYEREVPFGVLIDLLDPFFAGADPARLEGIPCEALQRLAPHVPSLAAYVDPHAADHPDHVRHAVRSVLDAHAARGPVALVIDDVQSADDETLEILRHLLRRAPEAPQLIVLAHRTGIESPLLQTAIATADGGYRRFPIELGPLTGAALSALLAAEGAEDPDGRLATLSGGNPFYLTELARAHRRAPERTPATDATEPLGDLAVPAPVRHAIAEELGTLSPAGRLLAQGAAVAWEPFDVDLAGRVAGIDPAEALAAFDALLDRDLVRPIPAGAALDFFTTGERYAYRHPIVRHAVYAWSSDAWLVEAHGRAAEVLLQRGLPGTIVAHHVARSARPGDARAADLLVAAGQGLVGQAPGAAARWLSAALRLVPSADVERRIEILAALVGALGTTGRLDECGVVLDELLAHATPGLTARRPDIVRALATWQHVTGDQSRLGQLLSDAARTGGDAADALHLELAVHHWLAEEPVRMTEHLALLTVEAGAARALAEALRGLHALDRADADAAAGHADAATRAVLAASRDDLAQHLFALYALGTLELDRGRPRVALRHAERGEALARATRQELYRLTFAALLCRTQVALGRLEHAKASAATAERIAQRFDRPRARTLAASARCLAALHTGDLEDALRSGDAALAAYAESPTGRWDEPVLLCVAEALLALGEPGAARAHLHAREGLRPFAAHLRPVALALLAEADVAAGRLDQAAATLSRASCIVGGERHAAAAARVERAEAALLLAQGRPHDAATLAARAAGRAHAAGLMLAAAQAELLAGEAHTAAGQRAAAVEHLRRAHRVFARSGADRDRDRAAHDLRTLGERVGRAAPRPAAVAAGTASASLSARERDVARLVTLGRSNRDIADELFLSVKTVETHLRNTFAKLGVTSRVQVARLMALEGPLSDAG